MESRVGRILMASALAITLAACVPSESADGDAREPTSTATPVADDTPSPATSPAQARRVEPEPDTFDPDFYQRNAQMALGALDHPPGISEERMALSIHRYCIGEREDESERPPDAGPAYSTIVMSVAEQGACPSWSEFVAGPPPHTPRPTPPGVLYEAEGASSMAVTFRTTTGTVQGNVSETMMDEAGEEGVFVGNVGNPYISVQNTSGRSASVTCRISIDGVIVAENTSSGSHVIATCNN